MNTIHLHVDGAQATACQRSRTQRGAVIEILPGGAAGGRETVWQAWRTPDGSDHNLVP